MNAKRTAKRTARVPAEIETVRRRFEPWRTQRRMPSPIPVRLWDQAVRLARHYGVSRISKILRVGYCPLKERVERQKDPAACCSESSPDVTFVERESPATSQGLACLVEWKDSSGAKMRVQLQGVKTIDEIVHRLEASNLPEQDRSIIGALFASYLYIVQLLQFTKITVARLKKTIFGRPSLL